MLRALRRAQSRAFIAANPKAAQPWDSPKFKIPGGDSRGVYLEKGWRVTPARSQWPGLTVEEVLPDWSRYTALLIELGNPGERPLTVLLRIDDDIAHERYNDRYNGSFTLAPHQRTTWRIPVASLAHRTVGRNLDLTRIRRVILFQDSAGQADPYVLYGLRLEP